MITGVASRATWRSSASTPQITRLAERDLLHLVIS